MLDIINESVGQKDKFRIAANRLLNSCFLIKKKEDTRKDYIFVRENQKDFREYFELLGYQLQINEDQGVIALVNTYGTGRLPLSKYESIFLLILRLLYVEKRKGLGTYSEDVTVLMEEIREKYVMLKVKAKPVMDKSMEKDAISLFRRYNLVTNIESDVTQADTRIIIYPSVIMAVSVEEINMYYENTKNKLKEYAGGEDDGDQKETADESSFD